MKSYQQVCGIARALDVIGDRWTLLILRDLLLGPQRYGELLAGLQGVTTNLLATRLQQLQNNGFVRRIGTERHAAYALTHAGQSVEPILFALGEWGWAHGTANNKRLRQRLRWALVALKRRLRPRGHNYQICLSSPTAGAFTIWEKGGQCGVSAGQVIGADFSLSGAENSLLKALVQADLAPWTSAGLKAEGQREVWTDLMRHLES